jgi:flagellar protein FliO/FliZ
MEGQFIFYLRPLLALMAVCCLIGLVAWVAKKSGLSEKLTGATGNTTKKQLSILEVLVLDPKRRLVLVKRDTTGHLLLLGPGGDIVVEAGIELSSQVIPFEHRPIGYADAKTQSA